jgi:hypothetical protein
VLQQCKCRLHAHTKTNTHLLGEQRRLRALHVHVQTLALLLHGLLRARDLGLLVLQTRVRASQIRVHVRALGLQLEVGGLELGATRLELVLLLERDALDLALGNVGRGLHL